LGLGENGKKQEIIIIICFIFFFVCLVFVVCFVEQPIHNAFRDRAAASELEPNFRLVKKPIWEWNAENKSWR
jgi:hypothetical protein